MSYFDGEIARVRAALRATENIAHVDTMRAFDLGLASGFNVALQAFGSWRSGVQRIGASDIPIQEAMEEFKAALIRAAEKK
jgi:hypothetical protein